MTAAEIVKALGGRNSMARCPAHDDRTPSLSVSNGRDGKLLVHCHAGCSQEAVWDALKDRGLVGTPNATAPAPVGAFLLDYPLGGIAGTTHEWKNTHSTWSSYEAWEKPSAQALAVSLDSAGAFFLW